MERIVQVQRLSEFLTEVQTFSNVRVSSHEIITYANPLGRTRLCLDVMGFNELEELIWLHHEFELQLGPGDNKPWTEQGKAIYAAHPGLVDLVREYLEQDYIVGTGLYRFSRDIEPLGGALEIAEWDAEARRFVRVETDTLERARLREGQR